jgi:hypothetical protein
MISLSMHVHVTCRIYDVVSSFNFNLFLSSLNIFFHTKKDILWTALLGLKENTFIHARRVIWSILHYNKTIRFPN